MSDRDENGDLCAPSRAFHVSHSAGDFIEKPKTKVKTKAKKDTAKDKNIEKDKDHSSPVPPPSPAAAADAAAAGAVQTELALLREQNALLRKQMVSNAKAASPPASSAMMAQGGVNFRDGVKIAPTNTNVNGGGGGGSALAPKTKTGIAMSYKDMCMGLSQKAAKGELGNMESAFMANNTPYGDMFRTPPIDLATALGDGDPAW